MKRLLRAVSVILLISLGISLMSMSAAAIGNDAAVLTSISYNADRVNADVGADRMINISIPYSHSTTFVLSNMFQLSYDNTVYSNVAIAGFSGAGTSNGIVSINVAAAEGASAITTMTLQYKNAAGTGDTYTTTYSITITRRSYVPSTFDGTVEINDCVFPTDRKITISSSLLTSFYKANDDGALSYVVITNISTAVGSMNYSQGQTISLSSLTSSNLVFTATSTGKTTYYFTAFYASGKSSVGSVALTINVTSTDISTPVTKTTSTGTNVYFQASDFYSGNFTTLQFTPQATSAGTWYYNGSALTAGAARTISVSNVGYLYFYASAPGTASFTWNITNDTVYCTTPGTGTLTISSGAATATAYSSTGTIIHGGTWTFAKSHFRYTPTSSTLKYIRIESIPATSEGYLYLTTELLKTGDYPAISKDTALKKGAIIPELYIQYLRMSTTQTSNSTSVSFTWSACIAASSTDETWSDQVNYTINFTAIDTISESTDLNTPLQFAASDFSEQFLEISSSSLSYVTFTLPAAAEGKLYYEYNSTTAKGTGVAASTKYYFSMTPYLSRIYFVPATDFTGTVTINYKAYTSAGSYSTGQIKITVSNSAAGTLAYTTDKNSYVQFDASEFVTAFKKATDYELHYVRFTLPSTSVGKLYYNYDYNLNYDYAVTSTDRFYVYTADYLSYVSFMPATDYTGTASISYTAYTSSGRSYSGKINITVQDAAAGIVQYNAGVDVPVDLVAADFAEEFISVRGSVLSYVTFKIPAATDGALYLDYDRETKTGTKLAASTKCYVSGASNISDVTFVPAKGIEGVITIEYTAYTTSGASYSGKLKITHGEVTAGVVSLSTARNTAVAFVSSDFTSAFSRQTGKTLSYVRFTPPSSRYGVIYSGYTSSGSLGTAINSSTSYYVSASPRISSLVFVPASGFTGTATINFRGYTSAGEVFDGKLKISVGTASSTIYYSVDLNSIVDFNANDFNDVVLNETGSTLNYVTFTLPSSGQGRMYLDYVGSTNTGSTVSSSTRYYRSSSPRISNITFVPAEGYVGTVTISYRAYATSGASYSGSVIISVTKEDIFNDLSYYSWAIDAIEYLYENDIVEGTGNGKFSPAAEIKRGDFMLMLYRAFDLTAASAGSFPDVPSSSYYYQAITTAKSLGIALGDSSGKFNPQNPITRQDAMLLVHRTLQYKGISLPVYSTTLSQFSDNGNISGYARDAVEALVRARIVIGSDGMLYPRSSITRAEMAVILYRVLTA